MSLLTKALQPKQIFQLCRVLNAAPAKQSHWFPDFKPGPYPKTEEERKAAAKKYNLLPEEYEPYPDDGDGSGDYPKLPFVSVDAKDEYYAYDVPAFRRDYMEPLHREAIILLPMAISTNRDTKTECKRALIFVLASAATIAVLYLCTLGKPHIPILEKQYPKEGVVHYTFDLDHGAPKKRKPVCICK